MTNFHWLCVLVVSAPLILTGCSGGDQKASEEKQYPIKGTVIAVNAGKPSVTLDHEDIPGLMKGMEMEFDVGNAKLLDGLQPTNQVEGQLQMKNGKLTIIGLQKKSER
jgi:Cu/Ag efflux protein CusF